MKKLNLENVEVAQEGDFKKPTNDRYVCIITKVEDFPEKEYLKIEYDILEGEFKGHYTKLKKERDWNMPFTFRSYKDSALPFFKGFTTSIENSNKGFIWENNEQDLVKKQCVFVIQEEEYVRQDGRIGKRNQVIAVHSKDFMKTDDFKKPETKKLSGVVEAKTSKPSFQNVGDMFDDDVQQTNIDEAFDDDLDDIFA